MIQFKFKDGKMHGYGMVCFKNGDRYEGFVRNNKMQGKGWLEWDYYNFDIFDILTFCLKKKGTYFHRNGDRYEG